MCSFVVGMYVPATFSDAIQEAVSHLFSRKKIKQVQFAQERLVDRLTQFAIGRRCMGEDVIGHPNFHMSSSGNGIDDACRESGGGTGINAVDHANAGTGT